MEFKKHHRSTCSILHKADRLCIDFLDTTWTVEEDAILYRYYPEFGAAECSKHLIRRTEKACHSRAVILKIKRLPMWSEEDNTILRLYYTIEGGEVYKRFNGKFNKHQCMQHARFLGLKATTNSADKWTEEDNEILRQYYPVEGKECYKRIQNANKQTVICQASKLCLKFLGSKVAPTRVKCIETGEIFNTQSEAQKKYPGHLTEHLKGKRPSSGKLPDGTKLHWEYINEDKKRSK